MNENKGCLKCGFNCKKYYNNGYWEFVCSHESNIIIYHKFDKDVTKYKKSQRKLNKKRLCENYKYLKRIKPPPPPAPPGKTIPLERT